LTFEGEGSHVYHSYVPLLKKEAEIVDNVAQFSTGILLKMAQFSIGINRLRYPQDFHYTAMPQSRFHLPLTALRSFEAAARLLSFKGAAEELRVTPTSVSNQIRQLERDWGCQLFLRKSHKVVLTDAGRSLAQVVNRAFDDIRTEVVNHITSRRKTVTVAVGPIFGSRWLIPRLSKFYKLHPQIELVLHQGSRITNADQLTTMVAADWGSGDWVGLEAHRLFSIRHAPVLSAGLMREGGGIRRTEDLARFPIIHHWSRDEWNAWLREAGVPDLKFAHEIIMRDSNHALQAAIEGQGVILGAFPLVTAEIEAGRLVRPLGIEIQPMRAFHLLTRPGARALPEVDAVCTWIEQEAALTG
jgi:LysR family glycine cleavage system transcriptional activator